MLLVFHHNRVELMMHRRPFHRNPIQKCDCEWMKSIQQQGMIGRRVARYANQRDLSPTRRLCHLLLSDPDAIEKSIFHPSLIFLITANNMERMASTHLSVIWRRTTPSKPNPQTSLLVIVCPTAWTTIIFHNPLN